MAAIKSSKAERIFYVVNYIVLTISALAAIFPLIYVVSTSLSGSNAIISGEVFLLPKQITLQSYRSIISDGQIFFALRNTLIVTLFGTAMNMLATILCAYPLAKKRLRGRVVFSRIIVFTMLFGGGLIPNFILYKELHLTDSYWALWLNGLISVYNMIIMKTFFQGIPDSLEEAAMIDGANDIQILYKIMLPLALPSIATLTLFYAVGWWNEYYNTMIFITSTKKYTATVKLMQMIKTMTNNLLNGENLSETEASLVPEGIKAASIVVSMAPILCVYPFLQKYFVKGVMVGSVKG